MFLATTALDEFWDTDQPLLLAGEWCRLYDKPIPNNLTYEVLPYMWEDANNIYDAQRHCKTVYEKVLQQFTETLNAYLNQNYDLKYYRILLGNWLIHFIHQGYDKYMVVTKALERGATETWCLAESEEQYPFSFLDYGAWQNEDIFQLQLFSQVIRAIGVPHVSKGLRNPQPLSSTFFNPKSLKLRIWESSLSLMSRGIRLLRKQKVKVVIVNPYFKKNEILFTLQLIMRSKGSLLFDGFRFQLKQDSREIDTSFRSRPVPISSSFDEWIFEICLKNIPLCYLEYREEFSCHIKNLYQGQGYCFFTYNDLYHNVPFQYFLAQNYKRVKILSAQHGCNYGMDIIHEGEDFERSVVDRFYTYGWTDSEQTRPLPMPKLLDEHSTYYQYSKILFVTTTRTRYIYRFLMAPTSTKMLTDHVDYPKRFLHKLDQFQNLVIRHHDVHDRRKWFNRQRIHDEFPQIVEDTNNSFYDSLAQSRVFVSDHLGTTFLEAMQGNVPTIVFINKTSYLFRESFQPYIDNFLRAKILFFDPETAAIHLNAVYDDIGSWWDGDSLQQIRKQFVQEHALTSKNWINVWCRELTSNSKGG